MRTSLDELLALGRPILADGATGTNYFGMGLGPGEPPEMWNLDHPERVLELHAAFVAAGADVILTNTFGCNRYRLALHGAEDRAYEIARRSAELASEVAAAADRPVLVAGSVGPTGDLLEPLGTMTEDSADGRIRGGDQWPARRRRRHRLDRDQVGRRRDAGGGASRDRVRRAVRGHRLVRHRRPDDDGAGAGGAGRRVRRARGATGSDRRQLRRGRVRSAARDPADPPRRRRRDRQEQLRRAAASRARRSCIPATRR